MCLCLMWKLKGYGPPTPREIRHFYTLRQAGNGGTYFLLSLAGENWIPEGVANPGQVEVSSDEKKKGFIWGFPTSNKRWKNSWFFTGGEWGRNVPAHNRHNLLARKVPRHFTSPEAWSKAAPALTDREVSHLAAAAVLPLDSRVCDFDTVCDLQARAVKNSEAASKRHAAGLAKDGIASPDAVTPSRKGKEKAGASRGVGSVEKRRVESGPSPVRPKVVARAGCRRGPSYPTGGSAEAENVAAPPSEGLMNRLSLLPPQPASPRPASPAVVVGEPAEEAKEKAELEAADLRNQLSSRDLIFENLKAVLEAESVDRFKRSPAYDALLLREFEKGMRQAKKFFAMKDHSNEKALKRFDKSLQQHMAHGVDSIKDQMTMESPLPL
ncbi:hypothetical protein LWI29_020980 [Acer saccharum]|uniref:Uncharacterized protein n=1 Tax=Acer saccharum TaxID=4024 RepID=A0AA39RDT2_ACESA|nr:hypothetical protein LWI29_020980 [Acer saccharum]